LQVSGLPPVPPVPPEVELPPVAVPPVATPVPPVAAPPVAVPPVGGLPPEACPPAPVPPVPVTPHVLEILNVLATGLEDTYTLSCFFAASHTVPSWFAGILDWLEYEGMTVPPRHSGVVADNP